MKIDEAIKNRRSIRKYKEEEFPNSDLDKIMESAMDAPSAGNLQSRRFYIIKDKEVRKTIAKGAYNQNFIYEAPIAVVVCADHRIQARYRSRGIQLYSIMDCSASIQNMLLTAYSLGLGSCWISAFDEEAITEILEVPIHLRPVAIVTLGYADEQPDQRHRVNQIEKIV
jgi:nitroreductase